MSLVDKVFGSIAAPLIERWGIPGVYVKHVEDQIYDPSLGTYSNQIDLSNGRPLVLSERVNISLQLLSLAPEEVGGEIQITDVKILVSPKELGDYYPKVSDWIEYDQAGAIRTARIIKPLSYRGDKPVFHSLIARLS